MIVPITSQEQMEEVINKPIPQLIIYVKNNTCPLCKRFVDKLQMVYGLSFYTFDIETNKEFYVRFKMSMFIPEARVMREGKIIWCRGGELFDSQILEMMQVLFTK